MQLLTTRQLSEALQCSQPAIRTWTRQGLPARRIGRLVRFELDAVLDWFERRERKATAR